MKSVVLYGGKYGSAERYARELAEKIDCPCFSYKEIKELASYDRVIYLGSLYEQGVCGLQQTLKRLARAGGAEFVLATVGLGDPTNKANTDCIKKTLRNQMSARQYDRTKLYHLRGAFDYSKLGRGHRLMMRLLYGRLKKVPAEERSVQEKMIFKTYGQAVDYVDFSTLEPLISDLTRTGSP